jgi:hypothetical protein
MERLGIVKRVCGFKRANPHWGTDLRFYSDDYYTKLLDEIESSIVSKGVESVLTKFFDDSDLADILSVHRSSLH